MSGLLTQVVRRRALMMIPRRQDSSLIIAGPPVTKLSTAVCSIDYYSFVD